MSDPSFPVTPRNRVKRLHERGHYDHATVHAVLDAAMLAHVAYVIDGQPYCTPTLIWRQGEVLYWHGSSASRMVRHFRDGAAACVTVSHLDALVLARCGFNHSVNYRSAMCYGTARLLSDPAEKAAQLVAAVDRFFPDRTASLRPTTEQEAKATAVIAMPIEEAAAKIRDKGLGDDEEDMGHPVWAGVIPLTTTMGAAQPCPRLMPGVGAPPELSVYAPGQPLEVALRRAQALHWPEG